MAVEQAAPTRALTYVPTQRTGSGRHLPAVRPPALWRQTRRRLLVWLIEVAVVVTLVAVVIGDVR